MLSSHWQHVESIEYHSPLALIASWQQASTTRWKDHQVWPWLLSMSRGAQQHQWLQTSPDWRPALILGRLCPRDSVQPMALPDLSSNLHPKRSRSSIGLPFACCWGDWHIHFLGVPHHHFLPRAHPSESHPLLDPMPLQTNPDHMLSGTYPPASQQRSQWSFQPMPGLLWNHFRSKSGTWKAASKQEKQKSHKARKTQYHLINTLSCPTQICVLCASCWFLYSDRSEGPKQKEIPTTCNKKRWTLHNACLAK